GASPYGDSLEEEQVYRKPDRRGAQGRRSRCAGRRAVPNPWRQPRHVLPMEEQVLWCAGVRVTATARTRSRERQAQAHVCGSGAGECSDQGRAEPKVLTPSARREVVEQLVQARLSITRACQIASLSRAAYYK